MLLTTYRANHCYSNIDGQVNLKLSNSIPFQSLLRFCNRMTGVPSFSHSVCLYARPLIKWHTSPKLFCFHSSNSLPSSALKRICPLNNFCIMLVCISWGVGVFALIDWFFIYGRKKSGYFCLFSFGWNTYFNIFNNSALSFWCTIITQICVFHHNDSLSSEK